MPKIWGFDVRTSLARLRYSKDTAFIIEVCRWEVKQQLGAFSPITLGWVLVHLFQDTWIPYALATSIFRSFCACVSTTFKTYNVRYFSLGSVSITGILFMS